MQWLSNLVKSKDQNQEEKMLEMINNSLTTQETVNTILNSLKSLKDQVNLLQNQLADVKSEADQPSLQTQLDTLKETFVYFKATEFCRLLNHFTDKTWTSPKLRAMSVNLGWYERNDKVDIINNLDMVVTGYNQSGLHHSSPRLFYSADALKFILSNQEHCWNLTKVIKNS